MRMRVYTDGAARGNPGPAGAGAILEVDGVPVARVGRYLGEQTNNVAEYEAVLLGLSAALDLGATEVELRSDSELLVKQLTGVYRVKAPHLKPYRQRVLDLAKRLARFEPRHVRREVNRAADAMANRAIDEALDGRIERL